MAEQTQDNKPVKVPGEITYSVAGQDVKLSYTIVRSFLTKGGGTVSDQDIVLFMSICKYNQLNPFLNEAYLVKFGQNPAQMVVSKEAFMKRAEACEDYEGFKAGIIVVRNGEPLELEGAFYMPGDVLVGGWAEVHRKDKKFAIIGKVSLEEYDKKQSLWKDKPSTMIRKTALVQSLREAFPTQLGALYTDSEVNIVETGYEDMTDKVKNAGREAAEKAKKETIKIDPKPQPEVVQPTTVQGEPVDPETGEVMSEPEPPKATPTKTVAPKPTPKPSAPAVTNPPVSTPVSGDDDDEDFKIPE